MALKQIHFKAERELAKSFKIKTTLENVSMTDKLVELMQNYVDDEIDKKKN